MPNVAVNSGPSGLTADNTPTFGFSAEVGATLRCSVTTGTPSFGPCSGASNHTPEQLADGDYQFIIEAIDSATNSATASRDFAVDTTPPDTVIDSGPTDTITTDEATFTFSGNPAGDTAKVQCQIDDQPFADCTSPKTFTGLSDGSHTASFRAEDAVGNQDQTPATTTFNFDPIVYKAKISKVKVKGPAKVKKGKKATYKVTVKNSGNADATGVKVKVKGKGVKAKKTVGTIPAGSSKTVKAKLKFKKPGKVKVTFKVTSKNAGGKTVKKKIRVKK